MRKCAFRPRRLGLEVLETRHLLATVSLEPTIDNTLYEDALGSISNGAGEHLFAGRIQPRSGGNVRRALVRFAVTNAVPDDAVITNVELQLQMSRSLGPDMHSVSLHRVTSVWGEGTSDAPGQEGGGATVTVGDATWLHGTFPNQSWQQAGGDFVALESASTMVAGNGLYTWSSDRMVDDVRGWLSDANLNFGWILIGNEITLGSAKRFDSRNNLDASKHPKLIIDFEESATPTVSISDSSIAEGDDGRKSIEFAVVLSEAATSDVSVQFSTQDGTATGDEDFVPKAGSVTFISGTLQQLIEIEVIGDVTTEPDESFVVRLDQATGAEIATASATGTIENDDPAPLLFAATTVVSEQDSGTILVNVALSNPSAFPVQLRYETVSETALADEDFVSQEGVIVFAPHETSQELQLVILDDDVVEGDETFRIELSEPVNVDIEGPLIVQILDDDVAPAAPWQNPLLAEDVSGDGLVVPYDALLIINELNEGGPRVLAPPGPGQPPPYLDVDGDNQLAPFDALRVINFLNALPIVAATNAVEHPIAIDPRRIVAAIELIYADEDRNSRSRSDGMTAR